MVCWRKCVLTPSCAIVAMKIPRCKVCYFESTEFVVVASADDRVITVDGIVPPNKGLKTKTFLTISNLWSIVSMCHWSRWFRSVHLFVTRRRRKLSVLREAKPSHYLCQIGYFSERSRFPLSCFGTGGKGDDTMGWIAVWSNTSKASRGVEFERQDSCLMWRASTAKAPYELGR